jgi:ribose transport system permease protein
MSPTAMNTPSDTALLEAAEAHKSARRAEWIRTSGVLIPTLVLLLAAILFIDNFATTSNVSDLLTRMSFVGFVAIGMTFVVASGSFVDLSVVAQIGVAGVTVIALQDHGMVVALAAGLGLCLLFGLVNGFAVGVLRANAVIVTLATTTIGTGVLTLVTQGSLYQGTNEAFAAFGKDRFGFVPISMVLLAAALVAAHVLLRYTAFGYQVKYTGSSPRFASVSGVPTVRTIFLCFILAAVGSWGAGVLLAGYSNTAISSIGLGYEFDAMAAVVIGGNSLFGGKASIARTALGLFLVTLITNVLLLLGLPYQVQAVTKGLVIITAVVIDAVATRRSSKAGS